MICNVKTLKTMTFVCSECKIPLNVEAETVTEAEEIAKSLGWTEKQNGQALCADCTC
jgi:hypothetical protein